jgi:hypothetical protein
VEIPSPQFNQDETHTIFEVPEDILPDLHSSLVWFSAQTEIPQPKVLSKNGDKVRLRFPGDFSPALDGSAVEQAVKDFRLLGEKFSTWRDVLDVKNRSIDDGLLLFLAQTLAVLKDAIRRWSKEGLAEELGELPETPAWAIRVLELRTAILRRRR